jgi:hypothetical protein
MTEKVESMPLSALPRTNSQLGWTEKKDHILARIGIKRMAHRVPPGLYRIGNPSSNDAVFVSANYTLSFDALRSSLTGVNGFILVLDTDGINVWCAAGKGTFGTEELVKRIEVTRLSGLVTHRKLIVPQLGAPGVSAHEVLHKTGFKVEYGPIRASDLPEYLAKGDASPDMRIVQFPLVDRLKVMLVDLMVAIWPMLLVSIILYFLGGWWPVAAAVTATLSGSLLFPILLPWLPTRYFSIKGFILGFITASPFVIHAIMDATIEVFWLKGILALAYLLTLPSLTAYLSLMFTGSTTFTSRTGVKREIAVYFPWMAWMFGIGVILAIVFFITSKFMGG